MAKDQARCEQAQSDRLQRVGTMSRRVTNARANVAAVLAGVRSYFSERVFRLAKTCTNKQPGAVSAASAAALAVTASDRRARLRLLLIS